jgi:hypothetical protein
MKPITIFLAVLMLFVGGAADANLSGINLIRVFIIVLPGKQILGNIGCPMERKDIANAIFGELAKVKDISVWKRGNQSKANIPTLEFFLQSYIPPSGDVGCTIAASAKLVKLGKNRREKILIWESPLTMAGYEGTPIKDSPYFSMHIPRGGLKTGAGAVVGATVLTRHFLKNWKSDNR